MPSVVAVAGSLVLISVPWLHLGQRRIAGAAIPLLLSTAAIVWLTGGPQGRPRVDRATARLVGTVLGGTIAAVAILAFAATRHTEEVFLSEGPVRLLQFCSLFVASFVLAFIVSRSGATDLLSFVGIIVSIVVLLLFWQLAAAAGLSISSSFAEAVRVGDPQPIFALFTRSYRSSGLGFLEFASASLRHVTVRGTIVASLVSLAFVGESSPARWTRWLAWLGIALGPIIAVVTVSRLNVVIVLAVLGLVAVRALGTLSRRVALGVGIGIVFSGLVVVALPLGRAVVTDRSTNSSEARVSQLEFAVGHLDDAFWVGMARVPDPATGLAIRSPHNTVLDLWLGGGVLAGVAGLVLLAVVARWTVRSARWTLGAEAEDVPRCAALFGLFLVALVRILFGGGGLLDPVAWFGLGFAAGIVGVFPELTTPTDRARSLRPWMLVPRRGSRRDEVIA